MSDWSSSSDLEDDERFIDEEADSHSEDDTYENMIGPYMFEPEVAGDDGDRDDMPAEDGNDDDWRRFCTPLTISQWCRCENCQTMPTEEECVCCHEVKHIMDKLLEQEALTGNLPHCITEHPGFQAVCLDQWSLQTAWLGYRQQYGGKAFEGPQHSKYRHVAYRQLTRWCWGLIGRHNRVILPACAVACIRAHYPPPGEDYIFKGYRRSEEEGLPVLR